MHGQRFALEYASLRLDKMDNPVFQAPDMLGKAGFTQALEKLGSSGEKFDIIFMDPPYKMVPEAALAAGEIICRLGILNDGGMLIIEHASDNPPADSVSELKSVRSCSYGTTVITFFKKCSEAR